MSRRWIRWGAWLVALSLTLVPMAGWAVNTFVTQTLGDDPYVLLVIGSDQGPPRPGPIDRARADGFHLVVVSPDRTEATVLSIPRDTWVSIPGVGRGKINASLAHGPGKVAETAEAVTGLHVDDWVLTGFRGIVKGVDALGGVTVDVETRLSDRSGAHSDLRPGLQTLDGDDALAYLRDRKSRSRGDLDRAAAGGKFLTSVHRQLHRSATSLSDLVDLLAVFQRHAETSLSTAELLALGKVALDLDPSNVQRVRAPVSLGSVGSASVVFLTSRAEAIFADLRDGVHDG